MSGTQDDFIGHQLWTTFDHVEIEIFESKRLRRLTLKPNETRLAFDLESAAAMNPTASISSVAATA
jgi:hypothetical protein